MDLDLQAGVFPGLRRPRVMWIGLGGETEALIQLQVALDTGLADLGFEKEKRPFKAHLTLARIKDRVDSGLVLRAIEAKGDFIPAFRLRLTGPSFIRP